MTIVVVSAAVVLLYSVKTGGTAVEKHFLVVFFKKPLSVYIDYRGLLHFIRPNTEINPMKTDFRVPPHGRLCRAVKVIKTVLWKTVFILGGFFIRFQNVRTVMRN